MIANITSGEYSSIVISSRQHSFPKPDQAPRTQRSKEREEFSSLRSLLLCVLGAKFFSAGLQQSLALPARDQGQDFFDDLLDRHAFGFGVEIGDDAVPQH